MAQTYAATINPGLEFALQSELRELGATKVKTFEGGATFRATHKVAYRAIKFLRCANQVRLRVDEFRARDAYELHRKIKRVEWSRLLPDRASICLRAATHTSRLNDTRAVIGTVTEAMESAGYRIADDGQEILCRLEDDRCVVSLDASGRELFKRGYRTQQVDAPIRESLACCCIALSERLATGFVDPCCGSGTFVIEAAMRAAGIAPRDDRDYPIKSWTNFDAAVYEQQIMERREPTATFSGYDIDKEAIEISRANAQRAGVSEFVAFAIRDVTEVEPDRAVLCNPPYDKRLKDRDLSVVEFLDTLPNATFVAPGKWRGSGKVLARFQNGGLPVKLVRSSPYSSV